MHLPGLQASPTSSIGSSSSFPVSPTTTGAKKDHAVKDLPLSVVAEIVVPPLRQVTTPQRRTKPTLVDEAAVLQLLMEDLGGSNENRDLTRHIAALHELAELCEHAKENRRTIFQAGGHLAIVQSLKMHQDNLELLSEGCCALANLTCLRETQTMVGRIGALELVVSLMRRHPHDATFHQRALASLRNMIHGHRDNSCRLLNLRDGLSTISMSMKAHPRNSRLQRNGIHTLTRLCDAPGYKNAILRGGCLSAIATAFENQVHDPDLQVLARRAMEQILQAPIQPNDHESCSSISTSDT